MDPALYELLERDGPEEVAALLRLRPRGELPPGVRQVLALGDVASVRFSVRDTPSVRGAPDVESLKAPRIFGPEPEDIAEEVVQSDSQLRAPRGATGKGVLVGVADWNFAIAHPNFRDEKGKTRIRRFWDQSADFDGANKYGRGRIFSQEEIDRALSTSDPYETLGYVPRHGPDGAHGTHVLDIAAGRPAFGRGGVAPDAEIALVHMGGVAKSPHQNFGDSVGLVEALDFFLETAGAGPVAINFSMGRYAGPHDGTTLSERAADAAVLSRPGIALVQSAGNYFTRRAALRGSLSGDEPARFSWVLMEGDRTVDELEIWYSGSDEVEVRLLDPAGAEAAIIPLGQQRRVFSDGREVGRAYHRWRDPQNADNLVNIFLETLAPPGEWTVELLPRRATKGQFHAWIERDPGGLLDEAALRGPTIDGRFTTGTIAHGREVISVGAAMRVEGGFRIAPFSSAGPSRDGRPAPTLVAPGVSEEAAKIDEKEPLTRKSGTSMAAPHVTGTVACMLEKNPGLGQREIKKLLTETAIKPALADPIGRAGAGLLNSESAVAAAVRRRSPATGSVAGEEQLENLWQTESSSVPSSVDARPTLRSSQTLALPNAIEALIEQTRPINDDLLEGWPIDRQGALVLLGDGKAFILPSHIGPVLGPPPGTPGANFLDAFISRDLGPLLGLPPVGAGGSRVFRTGSGLGVMLDVGQGLSAATTGGVRRTPGEQRAIYIQQLGALMRDMNIRELRAVILIHRHQDHYNQIERVVHEYRISPNQIVIPRPFVRGNVQSSFRRILDRFGDVFRNRWAPTYITLRPVDPADRILRGRFTLGDLRLDLFFRSSTLNTIRSAREPSNAQIDAASPIVRVTRRGEAGATIVIGDLRGRDIEDFHRQAGDGLFREIFRNATRIVGFSHHRGALGENDVAGIRLLLRETLVRTGRLEALVQTNPWRHTPARQATLLMMRQMGIRVLESNVAVGDSSSGVVATGNRAQATGPFSATHEPITNELATSLGRLRRLLRAEMNLDQWQGEIEAQIPGAGSQSRALVARSRRNLQGRIQDALDAVVRARARQPNLGQRGYRTDPAVRAAFRAVTGQTEAERQMGASWLREFSRLHLVRESDRSLRVRLYRAYFTGSFDLVAFRYMLSQIDRPSRDRMLYGPRGGLVDPQTAWRRTAVHYFGPRAAIANLTPRARGPVARGTARGLLALELFNIGAQLAQTISIHQSLSRNRNVQEFLKRAAFFRSLRGSPALVAVDDNLIGPQLERDLARIEEGIRSGRWDYLFIEHESNRPALDDFSIMIMLGVIASTCRNYDEWAELFNDSGQTAVRSRSGAEEGWTNNIWEVQVGRFNTRLINSVDARWVELPRLTEGMRRVSAMIIRNTESLLNRIGRGQIPVTQYQGELRIPRPLGDLRYTARLASAQAGQNVSVEVPSTGSHPSRASRISTSVSFGPRSRFFVWREEGDQAFVSGADYNTYISLRNLQRFRRTLVISASGTMATARVANGPGGAWIDRTRIRQVSLGQEAVNAFEEENRPTPMSLPLNAASSITEDVRQPG